MKHRCLLYTAALLLQTLLSAAQSVTWDTATLTKVSGGDTRNCGYARMIQRYDKSLLAVYEASGNTVCVTSKDLGKTWSEPVTIAARENGVNMAVPDILELRDRSLLACYNPRPGRADTSNRFAIRIKRSDDGGKTWKDEQTLYEAGHEFKNGCWEPSAIQLRYGRVQLYFANEGPYTNSDEQEISMLYSDDDGRTWSKTPQTVSFRPGKRDGMPVPVLLNNGKDIVFAIEDNYGANFKPYTIVYGSKQRRYALKDSIPDSIYAGAPYIRRLKSGQTVLSYQGTEGRRNDMNFAEMKVAVGDKQAMNFTGKTSPFSIPPDKHGLWNSLCVLEDDTIIAVTSTNAGGGRSEVWMIKGRIQQ